MSAEVLGSSPLARGKLRLRERDPHDQRLIPARAGKTSANILTRLIEQAHPRSRGENSPDGVVVPNQWGSSPLARGKLAALEERGLIVRLIPARAGKTEDSGTQTSTVTAHPRSRGENNRSRGRDSGKFGSSPLARGKLVAALISVIVARLIPARAGKTSAGA